MRLTVLWPFFSVHSVWLRNSICPDNIITTHCNNLSFWREQATTDCDGRLNYSIALLFRWLLDLCFERVAFESSHCSILNVFIVRFKQSEKKKLDNLCKWHSINSNSGIILQSKWKGSVTWALIQTNLKRDFMWAEWVNEWLFCCCCRNF